MGYVQINESVIPESCTSFSEMADHIAIYTQNEFGNLLESIGLSEYAEFESTGILTVYEGANLAELKNKFKARLDKIFGAIKAFWTKVLAEFARNNKRTAQYLKKVNFDSIPEKSYGKVHDYKYIGTIDYAKNANKFMDQVEKVFKGLMNHGYDKDKLNQAAGKLWNAMNGSISSVAGDNQKLMKRNLKDKLVGEEISVDKAWIKKNASKITETIDAGKSVAHIKDAYNKEGELFKAFEKRMNELDGTEFNDIFIEMEGMICDIIITTQNCFAVEMDAYKRRYTEYRSLATKIIRAAGVIVKEDVEPEVTMESSVSQMDMVDRAFNF